MRGAACYYLFVLLPLVMLTGCGDGVSGVWQGTIVTSETTVDRYGSRTETATVPFAVQLEWDDDDLDGLVKWGTLNMDDPVSIVGSDAIAYGTVLSDGSIHFSARTSTAAAPTMGTYRATTEGDTMVGTMYCIGEGYENVAYLVGEFTLKRQ
ncbi:MAG: hypothetical protein ACOX9R_08370 [Armatimonadota bacterium]